jgi:hypothetical protein
MALAGVFLVVVAAASWLGMMVVHEMGHVLGAALTGGRVARVILHPLSFSRTDLATNPRPLVVAWAGPVLGSLIPLVPLAIPGLRCGRLAPLFRAFAGFCLIANGAYIGAGIVEPVGDAADLVRFGAPKWSLLLFGLAAVAVGLVLWNGLGRSLGLRGSRVDPLAFAVAAGLLIVLTLGMLLWSL